MPTLLTWEYVGGEDGNEHRGLQRLYAGEAGIDDVLGEVTIVSMSGGDLMVEEVDEDGDAQTVRRTAGHIRAKHPRAHDRPAATGRPGQQKDGIFRFLGVAGASANPTPPKDKPKGKAAKGFWKAAAKPKPSASKSASASGKTVRKKPVAGKQRYAETPVAAAGGKRKEHEVAGKEGAPDDDNEDEDVVDAGEDSDDADEERGAAATNPLAALLSADYASSEDEEGSQVPGGGA
eukprot:CAMPEP_0183341202 /NCGR_PEP_ID=MMETSP0164_2-20130417/7479_1 /TAXON_ID=221442 /ORGANISM="Coccolithus pelagicus ssp braarudi, Strain PLY182g" /LENGTH=233 /DNA_ID=CAMNT_0025511451 /DNA_START=290 /DNA_END=987 /DNA_ORIENTATION=-